MAEDEIKLIEPTEDLADEFVAYSEEFRAANEPFVYGELDEASGDVAALVGRWRDQAAGRNLPDGYVPSSRYWLVCGRQILGTSRLRHRLTPALEDDGGNIGYEVRPSERNKDYATQLLAFMLEKARDLGLDRVLLTTNNPASTRVVEKNGGRRFSQGISKRDGKPICRYWIELKAGVENDVCD